MLRKSRGASSQRYAYGGMPHIAHQLAKGMRSGLFQLLQQIIWVCTRGLQSCWNCLSQDAQHQQLAKQLWLKPPHCPIKDHHVCCRLHRNWRMGFQTKLVPHSLSHLCSPSPHVMSSNFPVCIVRRDLHWGLQLDSYLSCSADDSLAAKGNQLEDNLNALRREIRAVRMAIEAIDEGDEKERSTSKDLATIQQQQPQDSIKKGASSGREGPDDKGLQRAGLAQRLTDLLAKKKQCKVVNSAIGGVVLGEEQFTPDIARFQLLVLYRGCLVHAWHIWNRSEWEYWFTITYHKAWMPRLWKLQEPCQLQHLLSRHMKDVRSTPAYAVSAWGFDLALIKPRVWPCTYKAKSTISKAWLSIPQDMFFFKVHIIICIPCLLGRQNSASLQASLADLEGEPEHPEEDKDEKAPAQLQEVDPFASTAPSGLVETERDRLIRLVRTDLAIKLQIISMALMKSCQAT